MATADDPKNVKCLGASAMSWNPMVAPFSGKAVTSELWCLVLGVGAG